MREAAGGGEEEDRRVPPRAAPLHASCFGWWVSFWDCLVLSLFFCAFGGFSEMGFFFLQLLML